MRKQIPTLTDGRLERVHVHCDDDHSGLILRRGPVTVAANLSVADWIVSVGSSVTLLAVSDPGITHHDGKLTLPPDSVALLEDRP